MAHVYEVMSENQPEDVVAARVYYDDLEGQDLHNVITMDLGSDDLDEEGVTWGMSKDEARNLAQAINDLLAELE